MFFSTRSLLLLFFIAVFGAGTLSRLATATALLLVQIQNKQSNSDASLAAVRRQDREARNSRGVITRLPPEEHLRRAAVYHANRAFDEAANIGRR